MTFMVLNIKVFMQKLNWKITEIKDVSFVGKSNVMFSIQNTGSSPAACTYTN